MWGELRPCVAMVPKHLTTPYDQLQIYYTTSSSYELMPYKVYLNVKKIMLHWYSGYMLNITLLWHQLSSPYLSSLLCFCIILTVQYYKKTHISDILLLICWMVCTERGTYCHFSVLAKKELAKAPWHDETLTAFSNNTEIKKSHDLDEQIQF